MKLAWSDPDAVIAALYREQARSLIGLARMYIDQRDAAEDVVQEAFIRLSMSLHRIDDPSKTAAYLRSIVLNLARDYNRQGVRALRHETQLLELDPYSIDDAIFRSHDRRLLLSATQGLPRRQRDCLLLHYLLELPVADIAERLALSPNSVKTHLKRGLAALRQIPELADDQLRQGR